MQYQRTTKLARKEQFKTSSPSQHQVSLNHLTIHPALDLRQPIDNQAMLNMLHPQSEPIDLSIQAFEEARFGHDFSRIPIHATQIPAPQAKLQVNQPGDIYEQEADRVAEQVMMTVSTSSPLASAESGDDERAAEKPLMRKVAGEMAIQETKEAPSPVNEVLSSGGQPLHEATRTFMEPRFGHNFSQVRVHTDERAAESAQAVNALAYTIGQDIVFGAGQYAPETSEGKRLIAHELTHVLQQQNPPSIVQILPQVSLPNDRREQKDNQKAQQASLQQKIMSERFSNGAILQRKEDLPDDPFPDVEDGEQPQLISLSDDGFEFILSHEGLMTHLYNDSQGHCTIGVGHLVHFGKCDKNNPKEAEFLNGITEEQARDLFRGDLSTRESAIQKALTGRINQYQYDAIVSFVFNIGTGAFLQSGVLKELNLENYSKVPAKMLEWSKPPEIKGRRKDEANLFRTGNY
jgi:GH24 family phage-related lysozyme (muramidase)